MAVTPETAERVSIALKAHGECLARYSEALQAATTANAELNITLNSFGDAVQAFLKEANSE